jgi:hypothetical protein
MNTHVPLWLAFAVFLGVIAAASVQEWAAGQYEVTRRGRFRFAVTRRWYGARAHVTLRAEAEADDPELYVVLDWDGEDSSVPSLKVHKLDPETLTCWDENSEAFWAPMTCFAPYTVLRFRPHFERFGRVFIPWLTLYLPLPLPAGFDARTPAEINTAYYLDTAAEQSR